MSELVCANYCGQLDSAGCGRVRIDQQVLLSKEKEEKKVAFNMSSFAFILFRIYR